MALRPNFFVTTGSVHGGFLRTDMESYLGTIRRMIQQKCATTQDLIQSIRRNKIGESGHVTPNEFRFTLIKFGVIMPQSLVDKIFQVFDSDRSGTMDFDEFAMWIMNSEFLYKEDGSSKRIKDEEEVMTKEQLRQKIIICMRDNGPLFQYMKKSLSFTEFISDVNRKSMPLTEREARAVFLVFDPLDTGFMDTEKLKHWASTGVLQTPPPTASKGKPVSNKLPTLLQSIAKICGQNTALLSQAFQHLPQGEGITVPFDEFRRCLLSCGLGQNLFDTKEFFAVLSTGQGNGQASIDTLNGSLHVPAKKPEQEVSGRPMRPNFAWTSHAHRRLREALRKTYKLIKAELDAADRGSTGFVDAPVLHSLLIKYCMPLSYQDFRYIVTKFQTEDNGSRVNWQQILAAFLPTKAPHMLDGVVSTIPEASASPMRTLAGSSSSTQPNLFSAASSSSSNRASSLAAVSSPVQVNKRAPPGSVPEVDDKLSSAARKAQKLQEPQKPRGLSIKDEISSKDNDPHSEMRRIWQVVLRECHRSDPDRSGCVSRIAFINALENANLNKVNLTACSSLIRLFIIRCFLFPSFRSSFVPYLLSLTAFFLILAPIPSHQCRPWRRSPWPALPTNTPIPRVSSTTWPASAPISRPYRKSPRHCTPSRRSPTRLWRAATTLGTLTTTEASRQGRIGRALQALREILPAWQPRRKPRWATCPLWKRPPPR